MCLRHIIIAIRVIETYTSIVLGMFCTVLLVQAYIK